MTARRGDHPVVAEYNRLASVYDHRWSFYIEASTRETLARLTLVPHARVLDVGCGTGALLAALAPAWPDARLTGVDPVRGMLDVARGRLPAPVALCQGWAEALPFADESFDAVVSSSAFHYVRGAAAALAEMERVLLPGGQVVITDWCGDFLSCRLIDRYLSWFNAAHHRTWRGEECAGSMRAAGLIDVSVERYRISRVWGLMTVRARKEGGA